MKNRPLHTILHSVAPRFWAPFLGAVMAAADLVPAVQPVSVAYTGAGSSVSAHGTSGAATFSGDGRTLLFLSDAPDLVFNDNNGVVEDVFVEDVGTGVVTLISVTPDGTSGGNGTSGPAGISQNGRRVVFASAASNLVLGDKNRASDIFLRDLDRGETRRISVGPGGAEADNASYDPVISTDGQSVVFLSLASNLIPGVAGSGYGVYQAHLGKGDLRRLDLRSDGLAPNAGSAAPIQNTNGTVIVFRSEATNLVTAASGRYTDLFFHRDVVSRLQQIVLPGTTNGIVLPIHTYNVSLSDDGRYLAFRTGSQSTTSLSHEGVWWFDLESGTNLHVSGTLASQNAGQDDGSGPEMSADGRTMVFQVWTQVGTSTSLQPSLRVWNDSMGLRMMSQFGAGAANAKDPATATDGVISPDGNRVAYLSSEAHPAAGVPTAGDVRLYVRTLTTGVTRVVGTAGFAGAESPVVEFNPEGTRFVFQSLDQESDALDLNRQFDVYLGSSDSDRIDLVTSGRGVPSRLGNLESEINVGGGAISEDGNRILFRSDADNLVRGDTNNVPDMFVRDLPSGRTFLASTGSDGGWLDQGARAAVLSGDGRAVAFVSSSLLIQPGDSNRMAKVFVRNLDTGTTVLASAPDRQAVGGTATASNPSISRDGSRVLFEYNGRDVVPDGSAVGFQNLYVRDLPTGRTYLINHYDFEQAIYPSNTSPGSGSISADGSTAVFLAGSGPFHNEAFLCALPANRLSKVGHLGLNGNVRQIGVSADGRRIFYVMTPDQATVVSLYWWDVATATENRVLSAPDLTSTISDVVMSGDGSTLIFRASFDPLGGSIPAGIKALFAYRIPAGHFLRVGAASDGTASQGSVDSASVSFDGRFVAFRGRADDLARGDTNQVSDVFVKDLVFGTTTLLSRSSITGRSGNNFSARPAISANGSRVAFLSFADDFAGGDYNQLGDVFATTVPQWLRLDVARGSNGSTVVLNWSTPAGVTSRLERQVRLGGINVWEPVGGPASAGGSEAGSTGPDGSNTTRTLFLGEGDAFFRINVP